MARARGIPLRPPVAAPGRSAGAAYDRSRGWFGWAESWFEAQGGGLRHPLR
ncbi:hypothetical protein J2X63_001389 [Agromyces sp. 3263]|uniref:hypothetical protein n=1 Tax=Agromyces sp. 3263 TaxID=2817750 RepID=UPI0028631A33|nr:hypothetical protein [Agromyces sp. 3263]MDR6905703.1 hypothetical protein [Agromyces sp. 3263]